MKKETWKDIKGYEGIYQVSDLGRVKSLDRIIERKNGNGSFFKKGQIQKLQDNGNGYKYKQLKHNGKSNNFYIHKLVMETFVGQRPNEMVICHKDGDKSNNRLDNLRYDTATENNIDQFRHNNKKGKLEIKDVLKVREMYKQGFSTKEISDYFNVGKWVVLRIKNGKNYSWLGDDGSIKESKTSISKD